MIVYTCLVGDLFHAGHVNYLRQCKELGDHLLVGVCSDEDCTLYKRKPILTLEERAAVIQSCRYVDVALLRPPSIITKVFMDAFHIDLVVHGDDSNEEQLRHFYGEAMDLGKYKSIPYTKGVSTTEIIGRIRSRSQSELDRRNFLTS